MQKNYFSMMLISFLALEVSPLHAGKIKPEAPSQDEGVNKPQRNICHFGFDDNFCEKFINKVMKSAPRDVENYESKVQTREAVDFSGGTTRNMSVVSLVAGIYNLGRAFSSPIVRGQFIRHGGLAGVFLTSSYYLATAWARELDVYDGLIEKENKSWKKLLSRHSEEWQETQDEVMMERFQRQEP